jgi:hypothetical protein
MALPPQVIQLVGADALDNFKYPRRVVEVAIVEEKTLVHYLLVAANAFYPRSVCPAGPTNQAMHFIAFVQEKFCEIRPILSCYSCNESLFCHNDPSVSVKSRIVDVKMLNVILLLGKDISGELR